MATPRTRSSAARSCASTAREDIAAGRPQRALELAARDGRYEDEGWRVRKDGSRFWANAIITALRDDAGRLRGFAKVTRNLTRRKETEEALRDAMAAAEKASQAKSEFLARMSHELRTPLNSLLILAKLLADNASGNLQPKQVQFARSIHDAGMDLLHLINDILDLARIESGAITHLDFVTGPLRPAARQPGKQFPAGGPAQGACLLDLDRRGPAAAFETDARRLQQILKNLLVERLQVHPARRRVAAALRRRRWNGRGHAGRWTRRGTRSPFRERIPGSA